jgi:hypothetical protein
MNVRLEFMKKMMKMKNNNNIKVRLLSNTSYDEFEFFVSDEKKGCH